MDIDHDRRVSLTEYQDWLSYAFDAMDRNRDTVLTSMLPAGFVARAAAVVLALAAVGVEESEVDRVEEEYRLRDKARLRAQKEEGTIFADRARELMFRPGAPLDPAS